MAAVRGGLGFASLILIAGSIVLIFFVVLSGVKDTSPLNKTYFLRADTSTLAGTNRTVSQWTYFYVCGDGNTDCGAPVPAMPLGYAWIGNNTGVPEHLAGSKGKGTTSTYYYYLWRFGWVFYLIGLFFDVVAFFTSLLAPCSRLASAFSGVVLAFALFWFSLATCLMTVTFVKARNVFRHAGLSAQIGKYAFGFTWGAWAAMVLATILLFLGCGLGGHRDNVTPTRTRGPFFFGRDRSRRSARRSFIDNESQRRVKDEYS